jgi:hydrogenase-4 component E
MIDYLVGPETLNFIGISILMLTLMQLGLRGFNHSINVYAAHSLLLAVMTAIIGHNALNVHIFIAAVATIVIKVVLIPQIMARLVSTFRAQQERWLLVNAPTSFMLAIGLMMLASHMTRMIMPARSLYATTLTVGIAVSMLGMLILVLRKDAVVQVIGLLTMENGFFLVGLILTGGMPFYVEAGIFFDVLLTGLLLWVYLRRMHFELKSTNTMRLNQLRG